MFQLWNRDPNKKNGEENVEKKKQGKKKKRRKASKECDSEKKEEWFHQEVSSVCFTQKFIDDGVGFGYEK